MMVQVNLVDLEEYIAVRMTAPSPLVGEGITNGRPKLNRVRGTVSQTAMRRQPLTRLRGVYHRAALRVDPLAKPPSPTRGEGKKNPAICVSQFP
jgi:hypothetical protein